MRLVLAALPLAALSVEARTMPPWGADNSQAIGAPAGAPDAITAATSLPTPFRSDAVLDIGGSYRPGLGAGGNRCFVADPQLNRDRLMTAIRVVASDPRAVAQVTLFALDSDAAEAEVQALDASDPGLGYSCFGTARTQDSHLAASWTCRAQRSPSHFLRLRDVGKYQPSGLW